MLWFLLTPNSISVVDVENYVIEDVEESEGENNLGEAELVVIPQASPAISATR
jgi:hypothetical protein